MTYDSRPATSFTASVVGELVIAVVKELRDHSTCHDRSKTESPEVQVIDEFTPKLKTSTYGQTSTRAISKRWAMVWSTTMRTTGIIRSSSARTE